MVTALLEGHCQPGQGGESSRFPGGGAALARAKELCSACPSLSVLCLTGSSVKAQLSLFVLQVEDAMLMFDKTTNRHRGKRDWGLCPHSVWSFCMGDHRPDPLR